MTNSYDGQVVVLIELRRAGRFAVDTPSEWSQGWRARASKMS